MLWVSVCPSTPNLLYIARVEYRHYKLHCLRLRAHAERVRREGVGHPEGFADGWINSLWSMDGPNLW